jgi:hypothetical protein
MADYRADEAAGSSTRRDAQPDNTNASQTVAFNISTELVIGCHICGKATNTSRCGGCKVVYYCSQEHQSLDRDAHKGSCSKIKKGRAKLEAQEATLRNHAGDVDTPPDAFKESGEGMGRFWGYKGTRPYMQARYSLVDALLKINTVQAVATALDHSIDMLRLNRNDNQNMKSIVPPLYLRLKRDQECYDFLKWWGTVGQNLDYSGPQFNLKDQDPLEPVIDFLKAFLPLSHLVSLALLKTRMLIDIRDIQTRSQTSDSQRPQRFTSSITIDKLEAFKSGRPEVLCDWLKRLVMNLYIAICCANEHFWPALLDPGNNLTLRPNGYMKGTPEEMQVTLQQCYNAWSETPGAIAIIEEMSTDREVREMLERIPAL